jgi:hypothetical protein
VRPFQRIATAITTLTISNDPVRAVVAGFIFGCGTGLLAITMMRIEWDMGPFAGLQDDAMRRRCALCSLASLR